MSKRRSAYRSDCRTPRLRALCRCGGLGGAAARRSACAQRSARTQHPLGAHGRRLYTASHHHALALSLAQILAPLYRSTRARAPTPTIGPRARECSRCGAALLPCIVRDERTLLHCGTARSSHPCAASALCVLLAALCVQDMRRAAEKSRFGEAASQHGAAEQRKCPSILAPPRLFSNALPRPRPPSLLPSISPRPPAANKTDAATRASARRGATCAPSRTAPSRAPTLRRSCRAPTAAAASRRTTSSSTGCTRSASGPRSASMAPAARGRSASSVR